MRCRLASLASVPSDRASSIDFRFPRIVCCFILAFANFGCTSQTQDSGTASNTDTGAAEAFVERASRELEDLDRRTTLAAFTDAIDKTPENTKALEELRLASNRAGLEFWKQAGPFAEMKLKGSTRRQIQLLRVPSDRPVPFDPKLAAESFALRSQMEKSYVDAQNCAAGGNCRTKDKLYKVLETSRKPADLLSAWLAWHDYGAAVKPTYTRFVELANIGARDRKLSDAGAALRSQYEMSPDAFAAEYDRLWNQLRPLYEQLHCHVRAKLHEHYGDLVPERGLIPAHLLGNMWAQYWQGIDELLDLPRAGKSIDVTRAIQDKKMSPEDLVRTAEASFRSMGFPELPPNFWQKSVLKKTGKNMNCQPTAWPIDPAHSDVRMSFCVEANENDLRTLHHELGHIYYYLSYANQPFLFQDGANPGFHEALGDTLAISLTPNYLQKIGLAPQDASVESDQLRYLIRIALDKLPTMATAAVVDTWRWKVYSGEIPPERYNEGWWEQVRKYQGVAPPISRSEKDFDAVMFYHISNNVPYDRYFTAGLLQFDFYKALCKAAGFQGELHKCSFFGSAAAGERLQNAMKLGASAPWPDVLEQLTGSKQIDGKAMVDYLAPVMTWLQKQNEGRSCGW